MPTFDKDQIEAITKAVLDAAVQIAKLTPVSWDDKVTMIARAIADQVFGLFGAESVVEPVYQAAVNEAAEKIRASLEV